MAEDLKDPRLDSDATGVLGSFRGAPIRLNGNGFTSLVCHNRYFAISKFLVFGYNFKGLGLLSADLPLELSGLSITINNEHYY